VGGPVKFETIGINMQLQTSTECKPKQKARMSSRRRTCRAAGRSAKFLFRGVKTGRFKVQC